MEGRHTFIATKFFGAEMDGQGEFEFEVTTRNTGSFEWTLTTDHDEDAYENWDNLWADIEMEVEEQVGSRWEDELDPGYGGHNPGFGDGFEVTLELTEEGAKEHGVEQEYAWVDWTASSSSPWYSAEGAVTATPREVKSTHPYGSNAGTRIAIYHRKSPGDVIPGWEAIKEDGKAWEVLGEHPYGHIEHQFYGDDRIAFNPDYYEKVAVANFHDKKDSHLVWRLTNNVDESWSRDFVLPKTFSWGEMERTKPLHIGEDGKEWGLRSSMVGDIYHDLTNDRMWIIANMGLEEVSNPENKSFAAEGREETQRMTRPEAEALADKVVKLVTPYVDRVEVCGSYRRGSPRPGDLDVVIIPKKGVTLPEIVKAIKPAEVHWMGEKKAQVLIDDHNVDFRTSSPKGWGAALLYFTGPAGYNIGMRVRAKKMGMKLNEYGIFDRNTNAYLGGATEDEIYTVLGKTLKLPVMRAEAVMDGCSHCGATGELMTMPTRIGHKMTFCGPVCLYKWEGRQRLAAEEVFEAPRAAFTNTAQAVWEKSYNIRAKKPLTKFLKQRMSGKKPSDDERGHSYYSHSTPDAQGVTSDEAKLIQGYATVMKMAASRFDTTNNFQDEAAYKMAKAGSTAYTISWDPRFNSGYLEEAVKDLHTLERMTKKEQTAYMASDAVNFKEKRLPEMRELLRYYDITMIGPYAGVKMIATDRAPYSISGGYGDVRYRGRNPYSFGRTKLVKDIFKYNSTKETLTIGNSDSSAAIFTRMTKMRPYTERPDITHSSAAFVEYETDGGSGWSRRGQGSQAFSLAPMILRDPRTNTLRNPNPGYSSQHDQVGWRWDVEDWESRSSAPYRYATMVAIPNGEGLQMTYGSRILHRNQIVDTINACTPLLKTALKDMADAKAKKEIKEEKESVLRNRNQALTKLEELTEDMMTTLRSRVSRARREGVSEDDIYMTLELTQYDLEQLVNDWEPDDYMAEGERFMTSRPYGCSVCGTGPHPTMLIEDEVWVACPKCGLTKGDSSATGWTGIDWSEKDPKPKDPIIDVAWEDSNSEG